MEIDHQGRITTHTPEELQAVWDIHYFVTGRRPDYWVTPAVECVQTPFSATASGVIREDLNTYVKTSTPNDNLKVRAEKMLSDIEPKKTFELHPGRFLKFPMERFRSVFRVGKTLGRLAFEQGQ